MKQQMDIVKIGSTLGVFLLLFNSCNKEIIPVVTDSEVAYINFYNAAEALVTQHDLRTENMLYIDDSTSHGSSIHRYPKFTEQADKRVYPQLASPTGSPIVPPGIGYDAVVWMPIKKGIHRYIYTSMHKNYLKTHLYAIDKAGSLTTMYLAESPEGDESYTIITVPEERAPQDGHVRIRVVHLGTDAGKLSIKRVNAQGTTAEQALTQNLTFGSYSPYITLDTAGVSTTNNLFLFRFFQESPLGAKELMTVPVPALPNTAFTLLVQGFVHATSRRILTGRQPDGSPLYRNVTVPAAIRTHVRRVQ